MIIQLTEHVFVVPGGVNIGVVRVEDRKVFLIDTGLNDTSAKKALKAVREELGAEVTAILTTHAHADHFGGNATVVKRTGCRVYAPAFDEAVLRYPLLQPAFLYGGADPLDTLRGRFLLADPSPVDEIVSPGPLTIFDLPIEVIALAGHSVNQLGYLIDGVFFCADVVLPEAVLDKYRIPYLFSVTDHLAALDTALTVTYRSAVPGHGLVLDSIADLVAINRRLIEAVCDQIVTLTASPATAEHLLTRLLNAYEAPVTDAASFYLLQPTIFAVLSHLQRQGRVEHLVRDGQSLWQRTRA